MLEIARGRHQSGLFLQRAMRQHRQIPIALGSGSSSLDDKVKAICRKFFAEAQSASEL